MDALFQIVVPEITQIDGLEVTQPVYEWDGVEYPQGSKIVSWQDISLSFDEQTRYVKKFLPPDYIGESWIWLKLSDETLDKYDISVKTETDNGKEGILETFLRLFLSDIDKWVVAFILHYDQIDSDYKLDLDGCISKLRNNLKRNIASEGFIAYK